MTDTTTKEDKTIRVERRKTLSLKRDTDTVRQSFSGGRSKSVLVEKKRRRVMPGEGGTQAMPESAAAPAKAPAPPARDERQERPQEPAAEPQRAARPGGVVLRTLTEEERGARGRALAEARVREAEERRHAEEEGRRRADEEARLARERSEAERRKAEEDARKSAEEQVRKRAEEEARRRLGEGEETRAPGAAAAEDEERKTVRAVARPKRAEPKPVRKSEADRRRGRLTVTNALQDGDRERSLASVRRRREKEKRQLHGFQPSTEKIVREVTIPEVLTVQDLANRMAERAVDVIRLLMKQGTMVKINDVLDADTAQLAAEELGHKVRRVSAADVEEGLFDQPDPE
jgi:translation initiation factor IF-2